MNNTKAGYWLGTTAELTAFFTDRDDAYIDPSTVSLTITLPDATTLTKTYALSELTRHASYDASGDIAYRYLYTTTQAGDHYYRFTGVVTGTATTIMEGKFNVRALH